MSDLCTYVEYKTYSAASQQVAICYENVMEKPVIVFARNATFLLNNIRTIHVVSERATDNNKMRIHVAKRQKERNKKTSPTHDYKLKKIQRMTGTGSAVKCNGINKFLWELLSTVTDQITLNFLAIVMDAANKRLRKANSKKNLVEF